MSKKLNLYVSRAEVYDEVGKITAYTGKKSAIDGTDYDALTVKQENAEIIDGFFSAACSSLMNALNRIAATVSSTDDEGLHAELSMTDNWDSDMTETVNREAMSYIVSYVCGRWMRLSGHADEEKYAADRNTVFSEIKLALNRRRRPVRFSSISNPFDELNKS